MVKDGSGTTRNTPVCTANGAGGTVTGSYTIQSGDPVSTASDWTFSLEQFTTFNCSGATEKTASLAFNVAKATIFSSSGLTNQQNCFGAGSKAYLTVAGLDQSKSDWSTTWMLPSSSTAAANTAGSDRPDSTSSGVLPSVSGSYLQYPPNTTATGDAWNRQANYDSGGAFPSFGTTNQGTWKLKFLKDSTHFVMLTVFSVNTTAPTISSPAGITTNTASGQCSQAVTYLAPTASSGCGNVTNITCSPPTGSTFAKGTNSVICTAIDEAGNTNTASFKIIVQDTEAPTIACPGNITTTNTPGQCYASGVNLGVPSATNDNCGLLTVTNDAPVQFSKGTTTVHWTAVDTSGNTITCNQTVTVNDTEAPSITCPANIVTNTAPGQCSQVVTYSIASSDNCPGQSINQTAGLASGGVFPKGSTLNTFVVTDASGNTNTCSFTVTVNDHQAPTITCPANIVTNTAAGQCSQVVTYSVTSSDNCPGQSFTQTAGLASGAVFPKGSTLNTFVVTDASGNSNTCSFTVTVNDMEAPVAPTIADATGQGSVTVTAPTTTDNCVGTVTGTTSDPLTYSAPGTFTVHWTFDDNSGNTNTASQTVIVESTNSDSDYDGITDAQELIDGTDPFDPDDYTPIRLGFWRFDNTNWLGEQGQAPLFFTNI